MVQDFLIILHVCSQILNFNLYAIQVTFVGTNILDIMHFATNSTELLLLIICIFAWNKCGIKFHSLIVFLQLEKLVIVCIHFTLTKTIFVILYKSFLAVLLGINACTILVECMLLYTLHNKHTNLPQQQHELQNIA